MNRTFRTLVANPAAVFALILAMLVARSTTPLRLPELAVEDGTQMLASFNTRDPAWIVRPYNGYVHTFTNAIAWVSTRGPVRLAPYLFTIAALSLAATGMTFVSTRRFSWLLADPVDRTAVAVLLAALPFGRGLLVHNLDYSIWSILFLLLLLLATPLPRTRTWLALQSLVVILCIAATPLSIVALPICLVHLVIEKERLHRLCIGAYIAAIFAYQALGVDATAPLNLSVNSVALAARLFLSRVVFETVFGSRATTTLLAHNPQYVYFLGIAILSILGCLTMSGKSRPRLAWFVAFALLISFSIVFVSTASRIIGRSDRESLILLPYFLRYFYVGKLTVAVLLLSQLIPRLRHAISTTGMPVRALIVAGCACYLIGVNRANNWLYGSSIEEGAKVAAFLAAVQEEVRSARAGYPYVSDWVLPREGGWNIAIHIDQRLGNAPPPKVVTGRGN